jgi:PAS domain S-box-containing protein
MVPDQGSSGVGERRLQAVLENSWDAVSLIDRNGIVQYASPSITRILGYAPAEFVGRHALEPMHPDDQPANAELFARLVQSPRATFTLTFRYRHRDGSWRWIEGTGTNLLDDPAVGAVVANYRDVTERRLAEQQLRERAEEVETLMEGLPVAVFIAHDPEARRITGNRAARALFRTPPAANLSMTAPPEERPPGRLCRDGRDIPPGELPLQRAARTGAEVRDVEVEVVFDDGTVKPLYGYASPLFDEQGRVRGSVGGFIDISERKALERALQQRAEQLADADRRKDEFLAILAHELRNPLAPIRTALHVLRMFDTREEGAEWAGQMIERQVQTLVRLVEDLLDVSRITCDKIRLRPERVDLADVVTRAVESARPLIDANRHRLSVSLPGGPFRLMADPTRLEQVFANLLNNAAKYTERGGTIGLAAERQGEEVVVRVRDTGFGIATDVLPRVFDLFTQADLTRDHSEGGLGIGLALVKRLVELHGGSVTAHSEGTGKGSEFVVRLPLVKENGGRVKEGKDETTSAPTPAPLPAARRILVVDDDRDAADSLALLLRLWGHEVRTSHDGQSALKAARSYQPDLVLLDIGLPGLNGYEVGRQLREEFGKEQMLLVAMTGYGQEEDRRRSQQAGFDHHWVKPVDPVALRALLAALDRVPR